MLEIRFHEAAELESAEAILWYEGLERGLGTRLRREIEKSVDRILKSPVQFPAVYRSDIRRLVLNQFPYSIFFTVEDNCVVVIAVFHWKRDPAVWRGRVD